MAQMSEPKSSVLLPQAAIRDFFFHNILLKVLLWQPPAAFGSLRLPQLQLQKHGHRHRHAGIQNNVQEYKYAHTSKDKHHLVYLICTTSKALP